MKHRVATIRRAVIALLATLFAVLPQVAQAEVLLSFHSFNGSYFGGRYPHAFIVMEGTLDRTGEAINESYGFSAKNTGPHVLFGPATHWIYPEEQEYIDTTNRHFTVPISDEMYDLIVYETSVWRDSYGKGYDLDNRNCLHFAGRIAEMVGLNVNYPWELRRQPRQWLNHISMLNPELGAKPIKG